MDTKYNIWMSLIIKLHLAASNKAAFLLYIKISHLKEKFVL